MRCDVCCIPCFKCIQVDSVAKLVKKGNTVEVDNIDMKIAVGQIK